MRNFVIAVAVLAAAAVIPLVVGAQEGGNQADGWETRLDGGTDATSVLHFRTMGDGVHASTAGRGGAIFWQPSSMAKGDYTISAMFTQTGRLEKPSYSVFSMPITRTRAIENRALVARRATGGRSAARSLDPLLAAG